VSPVHWHLVLCVVIGLGLAAIPAATQDRSGPLFRSGVDVLQLDVSVLDKDRRPVQGLTLADFTVEIGGKPAPIVAFAPVTLPLLTPPAAAWLTDVAPDVVSNQLPAEGRLIVLLFDRSLDFEQMDDARRIARTTVAAMAPGDLAAAVYVGQAVPQNFTGDRSKLLAAIDQPFLGDTSSGPPDSRGECFCDTCKLEAIEHVANSLRPVERRRKLLIFIGSDIEFQPKVGGSRCFIPLKDARTRAFRALDLANVVVHSLDPMGLVAGGTPASSPSPAPRGSGSGRQLNLGVLPARTGGRVVVNTNAPEEKVPEVLAESASYYVLGVERPAPRPNGRDQEVEIKVDRKGATVSASRAYNPVAPAARAESPASLKDPPRALVDALAGVWPATAIDLTMAASVFGVPGQEHSTVAIVTTITEPPMVARPIGPEPTARALNVLAGAWDRNGRPIATQTRTVELSLTPNQAAAAGGRVFEIASRLELPRGRHDVRVAVEDPATGRKGSVYTTVEVPNFERDGLSLSGLVVGAYPVAPLAPRDTFGDLLPVVPTAARTFTRASRVGAFVRVYQGGDPPRDVRMTARLVGIASEPIVDEVASLDAARFAASGGADYLIELPVAGLPSGPYLLTLTASRGDKVAERHMRFEMK
jgi:VWFA-related protein